MLDSVLVSKLDQFIELIKSTAPEVWATLVRQSTMEGVFGLIICLISALIVAYCTYKCLKLSKKPDYYDDYRLPVFAVVGFIFLCVFFTWIGDIKYMINPEFYAIKFLMK